MKNLIKKTTLLAVLIISMLAMSIVSASATSTLDTTQKVALTVTCKEANFEFTIYQVAILENIENNNTYSTKYKSLVTEIEDSIVNNDTSTMLSTLDSLEMTNITAVDTLISTNEQTKTIDNLAQGIYYIKATSCPKNTKSVQNSVVVLPYFDKVKEEWTYEYDKVDLATKIILEDKIDTNGEGDNVDTSGNGDNINTGDNNINFIFLISIMSGSIFTIATLLIKRKGKN